MKNKYNYFQNIETKFLRLGVLFKIHKHRQLELISL